MKINYHTHHYLCKHALGNMTAYIKEAIKNQYTELGISDHGPLPNPPFERMSLEAFKNVYIKEFEEARVKYQKQIKIALGLEIEYLEGIEEYYQKLLESVDYLILGPHYYSARKGLENKPYSLCNTKERLDEYVETIEKALGTKYFKILAHPDIFMVGYPKFDAFCEKAAERIIASAIKNNVILEINANGIRKGKTKLEDNEWIYGYPSKRFWQIVAQTDVLVMVGSDCHEPQLLNDEAMDEAINLANELNIKLVKSMSDFLKK